MVCRDIVENQLRPLLNAGKYEEMIKKWGEIISNQNIDVSKKTNDSFLSRSVKFGVMIYICFHLLIFINSFSRALGDLLASEYGSLLFLIYISII